MDNLNLHEKYMKRCLQLAQNGLGHVAPNPMVGSVIVHNNKIIGEGYHQEFGKAHAEVNAINSVKDKSLLKDSSIYVNLEPCAHYGKTPPCSLLISQHKIPNVYIGMIDPFAKVNGQGIKILKDNGCNVSHGILEKQCWDLNKEFITFHMKKRPFIVLKWAQTLDGFIDKIRNPEDPNQPNWITNEVCRSVVHKWRANLGGIMVGTNTAEIDNPQLNIRSWQGKNPVRIVIDQELKLSKQLALFDNSQPTIVLNKIKDSIEDRTEYVKIEFNDLFLNNLVKLLYEKNISSLIVEGGQELLYTFINKNLWDEARIFTGNKYFGSGVAAPNLRGNIVSSEKLRDNHLLVYKNY